MIPAVAYQVPGDFFAILDLPLVRHVSDVAALRSGQLVACLRAPATRAYAYSATWPSDPVVFVAKALRDSTKTWPLTLAERREAAQWLGSEAAASSSDEVRVLILDMLLEGAPTH